MRFQRRTVMAGAVALWGSAALSGAASADSPPASCPATTQQSVFVPPDTYPSPPSSGFYLGTNALWTIVTRDPAVWRALPKWPAGYRQKIFWFTTNIDNPNLALTVSGRRLDGNNSFQSSEANRGQSNDLGRFIVSGVVIPAAGCWEITGRLSDGKSQSQLQFVVWVEGN